MGVGPAQAGFRTLLMTGFMGLCDLPVHGLFLSASPIGTIWYRIGDPEISYIEQPGGRQDGR